MQRWNITAASAPFRWKSRLSKHGGWEVLIQLCGHVMVLYWTALTVQNTPESRELPGYFKLWPYMMEAALDMLWPWHCKMTYLEHILSLDWHHFDTVIIWSYGVETDVFWMLHTSHFWCQHITWYYWNVSPHIQKVICNMFSISGWKVWDIIVMFWILLVLIQIWSELL